MLNPVSGVVVSFFAYAFFGWAWETVYCSLVEKHFERRGFLFGPICPIYGVGAMSAVLLLDWIQNPWLLFAAGALLSTAIELIGAHILLVCFKRRWWDYSHIPGNYKGYICVPATILFGLFSVACVQVIQPALMQVLYVLAPHTLNLMAASFLGLCFVDLICSIDHEPIGVLPLDGAKNRIMYELQNYMYSR